MPWLVWATLLVVVLALFFSLRPGASEFEVRVVGLALQWLGIGTVVFGIRKTRELFETPSFIDLARSWVSTFPRWPHAVVVSVGTAAVGVSGIAAGVRVWTPVDSTASIESRIDALAKNQDRLRTELDGVRKDVDEKVRHQSEALRTEQKDRAAGDKSLDERLKAAETGGLHMSLAGVVFLFLGVLLATLAPEIAAWRAVTA